MKISKDTLNVLRSFSTINQSIYINKDESNLSTISIDKNILGRADIAESFEVDFGIYNLSEFLSASDLIEDAEYQFNDKYVLIHNNSSKIKYGYVEKELVISPPNEVKFPDVDVTLVIDADTLSKAIRAASVLKSPFLIIYNEDDKLMVGVSDPDDTSSNQWSTEICDYTEDKDFRFVISVSNLLLLPNDYEVEISSKGISKWTSLNSENNAEYYLALDRNLSKY